MHVLSIGGRHDRDGDEAEGVGGVVTVCGKAAGMAGLAEVEVVALVAAESAACDGRQSAAIARDDLDLDLERRLSFHTCPSIHLAPLGPDCSAFADVGQAELGWPVELGLRLVGQLELEIPVGLLVLVVLVLRALLPVGSKSSLQHDSPAPLASRQTQDFTLDHAFLGYLSLLPGRGVAFSARCDAGSARVKCFRDDGKRLIP
mmetsp:Transcript_18977/g.43553  ORF Transcript_18977/g.43553 Transcript_18977/m.43553 type:complete len:203 (-) Transcript_18977:345-953(-)